MILAKNRFRLGFRPRLSNFRAHTHKHSYSRVRGGSSFFPSVNNPEYPLEGLKLKLQYFSHLMQRASSLEKTLGKIESRRRRGQQRMRWLDNITNSMDMILSKLR